MSWVFPDSTSLPMMTIPAVFDMLFCYRKGTTASKLSARKPLPIKLAATHKEMTSGIGANKAAFVIEEFATTHGTKLPPVFLFLFLWMVMDIDDEGFIGHDIFL